MRPLHPAESGNTRCGLRDYVANASQKKPVARTESMLPPIWRAEYSCVANFSICRGMDHHERIAGKIPTLFGSFRELLVGLVQAPAGARSSVCRNQADWSVDREPSFTQGAPDCVEGVEVESRELNVELREPGGVIESSGGNTVFNLLRRLEIKPVKPFSPFPSTEMFDGLHNREHTGDRVRQRRSTSVARSAS